MNPFAVEKSDRMDSIGESELIERIRSWLGDVSPDSPRGIGDDCSVLPISPFENQLLVTADPVIYHKHFDDSLKPEQVASKLLKRNASDIAAMGGYPRSATLSLALPSRLSISWLQRFYKGLALEAKHLDTEISGGDISSTDDFIGAFLTLIGVANKRVLERRKATLNSKIYVTGDLGGSILGKHHNFEPRLAEGQWLSTQSTVLACMDLSDGIGKDCPALLEPGLGVLLQADDIPISAAALRLSEQSRRPALEHAINDGEDYELLFALAPSTDHEALQTAWRQVFETPLSLIGVVVEKKPGDPTLSFSETDAFIGFTGYEHFRSTQ
ncbi:MAG: thiamine-phosphate kinase [Opitutaceae bacterium]|nr:thiamine-phosphate kinase [Opitutaceae bacterium]